MINHCPIIDITFTTFKNNC